MYFHYGLMVSFFDVGIWEWTLKNGSDLLSNSTPLVFRALLLAPILLPTTKSLGKYANIYTTCSSKEPRVHPSAMQRLNQKTNMTSWKITLFSNKGIHFHAWLFLQPVMLVFVGVAENHSSNLSETILFHSPLSESMGFRAEKCWRHWQSLLSLTDRFGVFFCFCKGANSHFIPGIKFPKAGSFLMMILWWSMTHRLGEFSL